MYIAEWLAFHLMLGFDAAVIYDNQSSDNTRSAVSCFARRYDVRLRDWPRRDRLYQVAAYADALTRFSGEFEWGLFIDCDEFLIGFQDRFLDDFDPSVSQVLMNWATFGSSGHRTRPSGFVIQNYLHRVQDQHGINRHTKAFVRLDKVTGCGNPHHFGVRGRSVDIHGDDIVWTSDPGPGVSARAALDGPRLHHYWTKSAAEWREKNARGYPDQPSRSAADLSAFDDVADWRDESALYHVSDVRRVLSDLLFPALSVRGRH